VLQADGGVRPEPRMVVDEVVRAVVSMAGLPLDTNVATMTVMATKCRSWEASERVLLVEC
jgi:hypothetical protein